MAPLRNPPLVPNQANEMILGDRAAIITKKKIQNMFRIALDNGESVGYFDDAIDEHVSLLSRTSILTYSLFVFIFL